MTLHGRYTTIEGAEELSQRKLIVDVRSSSQRMRDWIVYPPNFAKLMLALAVLCFVLPFFLPLLFFALLAFIDEFQKAAQYLPMRYPAWAKLRDPGLLNPGSDKPMEPTGVMYFGIIDARDPYERGKQVFLSADDLTRHMLVLGTTGSGKAQPLDAKVHTPSGWKKMGELGVGDEVSTPDGKAAKITAIFPQGVVDIYRVTFADGRTTEACGNHLWEVHHKHWHGKYKPGVSRAGQAKPRVMSTLELADKLAKNKGKFSVPLPKAVEKPHASLPLHPYLLGVLIGDGDMRKYLRFTSADREIVEAVEATLPAEAEVCQYASDIKAGGYGYWIRSKPEFSFVGRHPDGSYARNPVKRILDDLGLMGTDCFTKFIPDLYRESSIEQRRMLLQGLMDTDGYAGSTCPSVSYTSVSLVLAEQVQEIVRSLGGLATITSRYPTYTHHGVKKIGALAYTVNIRHPDPESLFTLSRKKARVKDYQYADSLKLGVAKIERIGQKPAQCIMVDHPSHLYITDDYVVTHNSEFLKGMTFNVLCWASGFFVADAKADNKLPTDMYSQVRMFARDYDFLVVNYLLGGSSPTQIANMRERLSNGLQPATAADADTLVQMTSNIMVKAGGDSKTWQDRGLNLFRGICRALTHKRDLGELTLAIETLREYLALDKIEELYVEGYKLANGGPWPTPYLGVKSYLEVGLPGFQLQNMLRKHGCLNDEEEDAGPFGRGPGGPPAKKPPTNQSNECYNQHGYRADQVYPALSLLIDTYGHIFKRKHPEVDLQDVVVNNRICVSLIPSLEKGSQEQESLGKLNLALLRVMMARALGSSIEGDVEANVDSKITASATPFALFLDEFAYQFAEGIALTAAQARSLNFFLCALAQDLEKLTEGERAAEAGAMMANQATKFFMKIVGSDKTHDLAQKTLGEGEVAVLAGFERNVDSLFGSIRRDINFKMEKRPRIGRKVLEELASGFATFAYRERAHVMRTFYPSPEVPRVRYPRINRFLQIHDLGETSLLTSTVELAPNADKELLDRIRGILESGVAPAYPELVTSDVIQNIAAAARNMNPHTPAIERGIVLYEAGIQALRLARSTSATVLGGGSGSAGERLSPSGVSSATPAVAGQAAVAPGAQSSADLIAEMEEFNARGAAGADAETAQPGDPEPVADVLGVTGGLEERLAGFDPLAPSLLMEPPIVRKDKAAVFGDEMGVETVATPVVDPTDDALGSGVALSDDELLDGDAGLGGTEPDDDVQWVVDDVALATAEPEIPDIPSTAPEQGVAEAEPIAGADVTAATPPPEPAGAAAADGAAGALSGRDAEQLAAGLQALARTKVDVAVIDRLGSEVIGLRDNAKAELANLEVTLGATPEAAQEASKNTEKTVAQGLSLYDNNKTKTSAADFELLFSEFDNLLETK